MTAFDRQQVIESAARAMHNTAGQWRWERLSAEEPLWAEGWRDNAKAALPVIVAAVLKPIREQHGVPPLVHGRRETQRLLQPGRHRHVVALPDRSTL